MQTNIHPALKLIPEVQEAEDILRSCVHCGFCTAVCPTYQEVGDELDGPRGRIYLLKGLLEDNAIEDRAVQHLDRCLTCRSCETTCPSGVQYGRLLDIGRGLISEKREGTSLRSLQTRFLGWSMRKAILTPGLFARLLKLGNVFKPVMPGSIAKKVPALEPTKTAGVASASTSTRFDRQILLLEGCVQKSATPGVNTAIEQLLARHGIGVSYLPQEECCGALEYHLGAHTDAVARIKRQVQRIYTRLSEVEAIVSSASGCGVTIKDWADILKYEDPIMRDMAEAVVSKVKDISEVVLDLDLKCLDAKVAVHTPCTLQHGQKLPTHIEQIIQKAGATLVPVAEKHLCCGSAGTYSVLQPELSGRIAKRKVACLESNEPDVIVTGNIGCQLHLGAEAKTRVMHWAEFLMLERL